MFCRHCGGEHDPATGAFCEACGVYVGAPREAVVDMLARRRAGPAEPPRCPECGVETGDSSQCPGCGARQARSEAQMLGLRSSPRRAAAPARRAPADEFVAGGPVEFEFADDGTPVMVSGAPTRRPPPAPVVEPPRVSVPEPRAPAPEPPRVSVPAPHAPAPEGATLDFDAAGLADEG